VRRDRDSCHLVVQPADVLLEMERARASAGVSPVSMASDTSGRADSAATFGEVAAVEITTSSPIQRNPTGITRGVAAGRVASNPAGSAVALLVGEEAL
jgi:hypothetical protein